jgi:hypothetical protein
MAVPSHRGPDKPPNKPGDPSGEPQPPSTDIDVPIKTGRSRRGELEAQQKRYMDQRFGRDRPMTRKTPG